MKNFYLIGLIFLLSACDLGMPKMKLDFSHIPDNEIGNFIKNEFPNQISEQDLKNMLSNRTGANPSENNLRKAATSMGMLCPSNGTICNFKGYIIAKAYKGKNINMETHNIYEIYLDTHKGINSLKVRESISKITN